MELSDIVKPDSLTIENYGHDRPSKVYLAGMHAGEPRRWFALYCEPTDSVRKFAESRLVNGSISSIRLCFQLGGEHAGKVVAFASPCGGIGSARLGVIDGLGSCVLPAPFEGFASIVLRGPNHGA